MVLMCSTLYCLRTVVFFTCLILQKPFTVILHKMQQNFATFTWKRVNGAYSYPGQNGANNSTFRNIRVQDRRVILACMIIWEMRECDTRCLWQDVFYLTTVVSTNNKQLSVCITSTYNLDISSLDLNPLFWCRIMSSSHLTKSKAWKSGLITRWEVV